MGVRVEGAEVVLTGEWNIAGMIGQIDVLSETLQQMNAMGHRVLKIDCKELNSVDFHGLQVLKVWLQCARYRGMEPQLRNLPEWLQRIMLVTDFMPVDSGHCCESN